MPTFGHKYGNPKTTPNPYRVGSQRSIQPSWLYARRTKILFRSQMKSVAKGYNQDEEDKLLDSVHWQDNGYHLFDISVFAGSSSNGWFNPIAETNALFMHRNLWDELGGYDEAFVTPGGGLVNLDAYLRATELEGSVLVNLLGEGTFHQVHGGVATNQNRDEASWEVFHDEYKKLRHKSFEPTDRESLFIGSVQPKHKIRLYESMDYLGNYFHKG